MDEDEEEEIQKILDNPHEPITDSVEETRELFESYSFLDEEFRIAERFFTAVSNGECLLDGSENPEGLLLWGDAMLILHNFITSSLNILAGTDDYLIESGFMEELIGPSDDYFIHEMPVYKYPNIDFIKRKGKMYPEDEFPVYSKFEIGESSGTANSSDEGCLNPELLPLPIDEILLQQTDIDPNKYYKACTEDIGHKVTPPNQGLQTAVLDRYKYLDSMKDHSTEEFDILILHDGDDSTDMTNNEQNVGTNVIQEDNKPTEDDPTVTAKCADDNSTVQASEAIISLNSTEVDEVLSVFNNFRSSTYDTDDSPINWSDESSDEDVPAKPTVEVCEHAPVPTQVNILGDNYSDIDPPVDSPVIVNDAICQLNEVHPPEPEGTSDTSLKLNSEEVSEIMNVFNNFRSSTYDTDDSPINWSDESDDDVPTSTEIPDVLNAEVTTGSATIEDPVIANVTQGTVGELNTSELECTETPIASGQDNQSVKLNAEEVNEVLNIFNSFRQTSYDTDSSPINWSDESDDDNAVQASTSGEAPPANPILVADVSVTEEEVGGEAIERIAIVPPELSIESDVGDPEPSVNTQGNALSASEAKEVLDYFNSFRVTSYSDEEPINWSDESDGEGVVPIPQKSTTLEGESSSSITVGETVQVYENVSPNTVLTTEITPNPDNIPETQVGEKCVTDQQPVIERMNDKDAAEVLDFFNNFKSVTTDFEDEEIDWSDDSVEESIKQDKVALEKFSTEDEHEKPTVSVTELGSTSYSADINADLAVVDNLEQEADDSDGDEYRDEDFDSDNGPSEIEDENKYTEREEAKAESQSCKCYSFILANEAINYLEKLPCEINYFDQTYRCEINNILRVFEYFCSNNKELDDPERLAVVDVFYRTRHELLFKILCLSYNLPYEKSDVTFRTFGVDSDRTPDLIIETSEGLLILEVSASSSIEKAAVSKGLEEAGFESKYKKEMEMLENQGRSYTYIPILFDMGLIKSYDYMDMLAKLDRFFKPNLLYKQTLKIVREDLCIITLQLKRYMSAPSNILFSRVIPITPKHNDLSFMYNFKRDKIEYKEKYAELCISGPVYNKIINNWNRLEPILDRYPADNKVTLFVDTANHRISVKQGGEHKASDYLCVIRKDDKLSLFKMLKVKIGSEFINSTESSDGLKYVVRTDKHVDNNELSINFLIEHVTTIYKGEGFSFFDLTSYSNKINLYFSYNYESRSYIEGYGDLLESRITDNDRSKANDQSINYKVSDKVKLLANSELSSDIINSNFVNLIKDQCERNEFNETLPVMIQKNKNPFILPIASIDPTNYTSLKYKNKNLYFRIKEEIELTDPYTALILANVCGEDFEFMRDKGVPSAEYQKLLSQRVGLSRRMTQLCKEYYKSGILDCKVIRISQNKDHPLHLPFIELNGQLKKVNKSIKERLNIEKVCNETQLIRLPTNNKKTNLGKMFLKEMQHYKNKSEQSTISGIGYRESLHRDFDNDKCVFDNITGWLSEHCGKNPVELLDMGESEDCQLLRQLKKTAMDEYISLIKSVTESNLGHSASFVSNFAHSLLYYSQMPFNSEYVRVDNLGLKDTLLFVRGGKKIFKCKSSKMFRLLYPICPYAIPWLETGKGLKSSTIIITIEGTYYALTPWQQMHESILNDSVSFYTRVCSFAVLNSNTKIPFSYSFSKISFNVLLSYHNRRQTEVMLANLRYILLATLGDFTGIMDIFKEFLGFNYDCFQSYIRGCILRNYPEYFDKLMSVKDKKDKVPSFRDYVQKSPKNLFSNSDITTEEDLAIMIYSTFLMTKAPYKRPVERSRNLRGILEIHEYFDDTIKKSHNNEDQFNLQKMYEETNINLLKYNNLTEYAEKLFDNDFYYDPAYCAQVGVFADSYFINRGLKEEMFTTWNNILNSSWDELSTSTGLRGRFDDLQNFWGQKGYFVVYKNLVEDIEYMTDVKRLLKTNMDIDSKRKLLRDLNIVFKVKIEEPQEFLLFHAVDKVQWRGGREIYVMDIDTKTVQQPIEKFMGYLCSKIDNELISIPSDKRAQVIHHSIFEKDVPTSDVLTWYLTLDCSKWAPKSNYLKFIDTILPMTCMPPTFKTHFLNYLQKLFKKRVYFNCAEVDVLRKNNMYKAIVEKYLKYDNVHKGYYLEMQYSWVMGIFNYTSSFLHAMNQKYASYLIFKTSLVSYDAETVVFMFAHSDDSGGRLTCENKFLMTRALSLYELQLKMCNHILSKKKSVVSRFYFEILSVIYIFKKLLALLPKFLGGLRFLPSDKGPCHDMLASYSKCIEVMVAGACFNVAYLVMKMYAQMVYRFYNHTPTSTNRYKVPVQYFGLPDAHPLMVLLCGSDSDIVRIMHTQGKMQLVKMHAFFNKVTQTIEDEGPIKPVKFNIKVRGLKKGFEDSIFNYGEEISSWSISNVNFHSTPMNFLTFLSKLNDPGFIGSLVNESPIRRISRAFFMRKGDCIMTCLGEISMDTMYDVIDMLLIGLNPKSKFYSIIPREIVSGLTTDIEDSIPISIRQIDVLEATLNSPLRIMRYMDELSLVGKEIVNVTRTIKPTHVELTKSPRTFSVPFDPAQMVSYIKEPEWAWALPNLRNLFTGRQEVENLCADFGFDLGSLSPSTLLKLCRTYSNKYKKSIYMYSQVPSEIRQVKTYSSFLTFLSTNTFPNCEIKGLVLRLRGNLTDPGYLPINIDEDVYIINNTLSIIKTFIKVSGMQTIKSLKINKIKAISFEGGTVDELLGHLSNISKEMEDSVHFNLQLCYLRDKMLDKFSSHTDASFIKKSSFYYFPKSQKSQGGWSGKGKMLVYISGSIYLFELYNNLVNSLVTNQSGKVDKRDISYIMDVMSKSGLSFNQRGINDNSKIVFGVDQNGDYSVGRSNEINKGILAEENLFIPSVVDHCERMSIREYGPNSFNLVHDQNIGIKQTKIYTLPLMQGEILNIIKMMFDPKCFEKIMLEKGIGDFEEYVLTEVMTEFGFEASIGPIEFFDNYQSSEVYKILQKVKKESISKLPKKIENCFLPANEGGLLRILLDYTRVVGEPLIKTPQNLTPELMELRAQHPDSVVAILSDRLIKCHTDIYSNLEVTEIKNAYEGLYKYNSLEELEKNFVKLLVHWGYGALVNSLENFKIAKNDVNFGYFNLGDIEKIESRHTSDIFLDLHRAICKSMFAHYYIYDGINVPVQRLRNKRGVAHVINNMNLSITFGLYRFNYCMAHYSHARVVFINALLGYLEDEEFVNTLIKEAQDNYILCSINFNFRNRNKIVAMYNTMLYVYMRVNNFKSNNLDFLKRLQRLEVVVENPTSAYNKLCFKELLDYVPKFSVYYHSFLNDDMVAFMNSAVSVKSGKYTYRVSQSICKPSEQKVPLTSIIPLSFMLNDSVFDTEEWDEIICTIEMGGAEKEDIEEYWEAIEKKFKRPRTRRINENKVIQTTINWVIDPYVQNISGCENYYRQCGENLAIVTTDYISGFNNMPNNHVRYVNFGNLLKNRNCPDMLVYISCDKTMDKQFWDKLIGGTVIDQLTWEIVDKLGLDNYFIGRDKVGYFTDRKVQHEDFFKTAEQKLKDMEDKERAERASNLLMKGNNESMTEQNSLEPINENDDDFFDRINNLILETEAAGAITSRMKWRLIEKYSDKKLVKIMDKEEIFKNLVNETNLRKMHKSLVEGGLKGITSEKYSNIFQSPQHFGMAYAKSSDYSRGIKDKKVNAELNSIHSNLSNLISSDNLMISEHMHKIISAHYKMWLSVIRGCKYKKENKKFMVFLFLTIINTAKVVPGVDKSMDDVWQDISNLYTIYIADDGPDDDDDEEFFPIDENLISASRLKYKASGF
jgi:hypothetical protein